MFHVISIQIKSKETKLTTAMEDVTIFVLKTTTFFVLWNSGLSKLSAKYFKSWTKLFYSASFLMKPKIVDFVLSILIRMQSSSTHNVFLYAFNFELYIVVLQCTCIKLNIFQIQIFWYHFLSNHSKETTFTIVMQDVTI